MELLIDGGNVRCVYGEDVELRKFGEVSIRRGSHVEPTDDGRWTADLAPVNGPQLGPFATRTEALNAEHQWLLGNWLMKSDNDS